MKRTLAFCLLGAAICAATLVTGQIGGRPNPNGWQLCDGDCPSPPPCYNGTSSFREDRLFGLAGSGRRRAGGFGVE